MIGMTADGIVCGRLGRRLPEAELLGSDRLARSQRIAVGSATDGRASALRWKRRLSQAQPEAERREAEGGNTGPERESNATEAERRRRRFPNEKRKRKESDSKSQPAASDSDAAETMQPSKRMRDFHVDRRDVDKFGSTAKCPGCADAALGISGRPPTTSAAIG